MDLGCLAPKTQLNNQVNHNSQPWADSTQVCCLASQVKDNWTFTNGTSAAAGGSLIEATAPAKQLDPGTVGPDKLFRISGSSMCLLLLLVRWGIVYPHRTDWLQSQETIATAVYDIFTTVNQPLLFFGFCANRCDEKNLHEFLTQAHILWGGTHFQQHLILQWTNPSTCRFQWGTGRCHIANFNDQVQF